MAEVTPESFRSRLPAGAQRPCADCNGAASWMDTPASNGSRIAVVHEPGCPGFRGRLPAGVQPGSIVCDDCGSAAVWLDAAMPDDLHVVLEHRWNCPGSVATPAAHQSTDPREDTP